MWRYPDSNHWLFPVRQTGSRVQDAMVNYNPVSNESAENQSEDAYETLSNYLIYTKNHFLEVRNTLTIKDT